MEAECYITHAVGSSQATLASTTDVIHIQHCSVESDSPLRPDQPGVEFKREAMPIKGEQIFKKSVNSAFIGTNLESYLRENGIEEIVIAGLT